jgi:muramoyltetrapeptide carboxypeptidase
MLLVNGGGFVLMPPIIKPKGLRRGDTVGVVAPAGPVDRDRMERALTRLQQRGFRIKTYGDIYRSRGYLAGDDATRASELMAAFADPESAAVWCARGGYGVVRILDRLDFDVIGRSPKVFVGFSDITLLHMAIQQRTGLITFHAPNLQDGFGKADDMPAANEAALWRAILVSDEQHAGTSTADRGYAFDFVGVDNLDLRPICPGIATGRLIGGNLAVICGIIGTPFEIETAGRILFLEDISERSYRIDRYLSQLNLADKLADVAGVLLGTFSYEEGETADEQSDIRALFKEYLEPLGVPVLAGFPAGHELYNLALPMGACVQVDADHKSVTVCERPQLGR